MRKKTMKLKIEKKKSKKDSNYNYDIELNFIALLTIRISFMQGKPRVNNNEQRKMNTRKDHRAGSVCI